MILPSSSKKSKIRCPFTAVNCNLVEILKKKKNPWILHGNYFQLRLSINNQL